ncbi:MAG: sterol carrier protein domain-containing protein [Pseudonocardiaceae bacterium]
MSAPRPPVPGIPGCCASWTWVRPCGYAAGRTIWTSPSRSTSLPTPTTPPSGSPCESPQARGELAPSACEGRLRLTRRQFAVWYAGGYRTVTAATLAGVRGDPQEVARLVLATADREPWLPEHF